MKLYEKLEELNSIQIVDNVESWQEGIKLCFDPLLKKQYISNNYIDSVIQKGIDLNFYFLLTQNMAMPHSRPEDGVNESGVTLLIVKEGVKFGDHEFNPVYCLIGLAAKDSDSHISIMMDISELFGDNPNIIDRLRACITKEEVINILKQQ